jgi:hypothetical protein
MLTRTHSIIVAAALALGTLATTRAAVLPEGFAEETLGSGWTSLVGAEENNVPGSPGRVFAWEAYGKVWLVENGTRLATPVVDISTEVGNFISLLGFAADPNFAANGHIYLLYTVDRAQINSRPMAASGPVFSPPPPACPFQ